MSRAEYVTKDKQIEKNETQQENNTNTQLKNKRIFDIQKHLSFTKKNDYNSLSKFQKMKCGVGKLGSPKETNCKENLMNKNT